MVSQLVEMQWKSHYSVHMLEKMLAPGQIKRPLLNRNRLVRISVWNCSTEEEEEEGGLAKRSATT